MTAEEMSDDDEALTTGSIESSSRPKADRLLAVTRRMPIHRGPSGLVLLAGERVVLIPSREFDDEVQSVWCEAYADETLSAGTINRVVASIKADRSIPETDRVPPPPVKRTAAAELAWQVVLVTDHRGDPVDCTANLIAVLRHHPDFEGVLRFDAFKQTVSISRELPFKRPDDAPLEWLETDDTRMQEWAQRTLGFEPSRSAVADSVAVVAEENAFHPVRDYFDEVERTWDGEERLPTMLANYFGARPGPYTAGIGTCWMISAVARVRRPGCQADYMIGLEGDQGIGKSSGLRTLCPRPEWYSDTGVTIGHKDSYTALHGKLIYCFDELSSIKGSEVTKTKNFLTSITDNFRPAYGRRNRDFLRQVVFAYTTNETVYLRDRTGNRRAWPAECSRVNVEAIARDRDQLWAEACVRFSRGEKWWPDATLERLCAAEQEERVVGDPWSDVIAGWIRNPTEPSVDAQGRPTRDPCDTSQGITSAQILVAALGKRPGDITRADEMRVAEVLRELGWAHDTSRPRDGNGRRVRRWTNPGSNVNGGGRSE